eukprot:722524_1
MRSSNISVALHSSIDSSNSKMEVELDDGACHYTIRFLTACTSYTSSIILFLPFQFISFKNINASLFLLRPLLSYSNSNNMMTTLSPNDDISTLYQAIFICIYCFHFARRIFEVLCIHKYQRSAPLFEIFDRCFHILWWLICLQFILLQYKYVFHLLGSVLYPANLE